MEADFAAEVRGHGGYSGTRDSQQEASVGRGVMDRLSATDLHRCPSRRL